MQTSFSAPLIPSLRTWSDSGSKGLRQVQSVLGTEHVLGSLSCPPSQVVIQLPVHRGPLESGEAGTISGDESWPISPLPPSKLWNHTSELPPMANGTDDNLPLGTFLISTLQLSSARVSTVPIQSLLPWVVWHLSACKTVPCIPMRTVCLLPVASLMMLPDDDPRDGKTQTVSEDCRLGCLGGSVT